MVRVAAAIGLVVSCAPALAAGGSATGGFKSLYSEVSRTRCPNDFNRPLSQLGDHQPITYSCPGRAGYAVDVVYEGAYVRVLFRRTGEKRVAAQLGAGYDVGDTVEWRGIPSASGFEPRAAIIRLKIRDAKGKLGEVLGLVRVDGGRACAAAFIDAAANRDASELARRTADEIAEGAGCGELAPRVVGVATERAAAAMAAAR